MSPLRLAKVAAIAAPLAFFFACSSSKTSVSGSSTTNDVGGAGGTGGQASTPSSSATAMGQGGGASIDAGSIDAAALSCLGDPMKWKELTSIPGACQYDTDCCVIISPCLSEAQVVAEAQMEEALNVWPHCSGQCNDCVPPAIDVACIGGQCRGHMLIALKPDSPLRINHCGSNTKITPPVGMTDTHFACTN